MPEPDEKRRSTPADRFRSIIAAEQNRENTAAGRTHSRATGPTSLNLPKPTGGDSRSTSGAKAAPAKTNGAHMEVNRYLPAFWTIASIISLIFNIILVVAILGLLRMAGNLNAASLGPGVLGGLYTNFERMDQAHIKTTIPIQTTIPLNLTVPVQTTTLITLAKDVSIPGAHVRINTALFNIDAPANVTLPAGTGLDVALSFALPVQNQVPVNLNVPVDIAVSNTDLHPAIVGLQDTIRPLYCIVTPSAQSLSGQPVCR